MNSGAISLYPLRLPCESLPLISAAGIPLMAVSRRRIGQNSVSARTRALGQSLSRNLFTEEGMSSGRYDP